MEQFSQDDSFILQMIMMFQSSAMQSLGLLENPVTNQEEKNPEQAKFFIDSIRALQNKIKSNIPKELDDIITQILTELQLKYVEITTKK